MFMEIDAWKVLIFIFERKNKTNRNLTTASRYLLTWNVKDFIIVDTFHTNFRSSKYMGGLHHVQQYV